MMIKKFFDKNSFIHVFVGSLAYTWGFSIYKLLIIHILFEIAENTSHGLFIANQYFYVWPNGERKAESITNIIGDIISAIFGWFLADYIFSLFT